MEDSLISVGSIDHITTFDTETFPHSFQHGMTGTCWWGSRAFSLCDHDNCNEATRILDADAC